jgi:hypothetical protein
MYVNYGELDVTCDLFVESCTILVCMLVDSRTFVTLDGLPGLYGLKYDSLTALVITIVLVLL